MQAFIDEEHAEAVFDSRYQGIYDNRCLELPTFDQLVRDASTDAPPSPDQLSSSLRRLLSDGTSVLGDTASTSTG